MNTQLERPRGHTSLEDDPHHNASLQAGEGHDENEHHGEKKSVLKKVKAKAKKIKDTIKGHVGHGNEHGHGHDHDEDDDDDDEGDEMETDPGVHGAHGSHPPMGGPGDQQTSDPTKQTYIPGTRLPTPAVTAGTQTFDPTTARYTPGQEEALSHSRTDTGRPIVGSEEQSYTPKNTPTAVQAGGTGGLSSGQAGHRRPMEFEEGHISETGPNHGGGILGTHPLGMPMGSEEQRSSATGATHEQHPSTVRPARGQYVSVPGATHGGSVPGTGLLSSRSPIEPKEQTVSKTAASHGADVLGTGHVGSRMPEEQRISATGLTHGVDVLGREQLPSTRRPIGSEEDHPYMSKSMDIDVPSGGTHAGGGTLGIGHLLGSRRPSDTHRGADTLRTGQQGISGEIGGILESPGGLEEDPHGPKGEGEARDPENYQTKVTDPTGMGSKEIGITPILHRMDRMKLHDQSDNEQREKPSTGQGEALFKPRTDQGIPVSTDAMDEKSSAGSHDDQLPTSSPFEKLSRRHDQVSTNVADESSITGSHDRVSPEPESTVTTKTTIYIQELGTDPGTQQGLDVEDETDQQKQGSYTEKVSSAASMVADKAKQATAAVTSKLGYGGTNEEGRGYGEKISSVTGAIADKAVHAKDAVASKLGYGGTYEEGQVEEPRAVGSSIGDYGKKVQEKLAEVGSTVASKVGVGSGTTDLSKARTADVGEVGVGGAPDKGVSVKEYLVEKLKPGEEDKALSAVITDALPLHKQKEKEEVSGVKGRVIESEEVKERLGAYEESGQEEDGKGMLDKIKGAATSWFGKGGETQPLAKGFLDSSKGNVEEQNR